MVIDNAASRLVAILKEAEQIDINTPCRRAWERILSCERNDNSQLFLLLGNAMRLPSEVASLVTLHFPHQAGTIALWKDPIDNAFLNQNLQNSWQSFRQHLNSYCIPQLSLVTDLLHTKIGATLLGEQQLEELRAKFNSLLEDVSKAELTSPLKIYLSREIARLLQLLREYGICGAEPILHQADAMFGHIVRNKEYRSFLKDEELGKRLLDNLSAMANLMTVATGLPSLTVAITSLLP